MTDAGFRLYESQNRPAVSASTCAHLSTEVEGVRSQLGRLQQEREKLKLEIGNLAAVIAQGRNPPTLLTELEKRERRLTEISDEIFSSSENGLDAQLKEIEDFVMRCLGDFHGLLNGNVQGAKSEPAKHCIEITLTPEEQTLPDKRRLESVGRTFGWCRGPDTATS